MNILSALKKYLNTDLSIYNNLIREEAKIGGQLFGGTPKNVSRSFFCLDEYTWIWHEDILQKNGSVVSNIVKYQVHPDQIVKIINGNQYLLSNHEKSNFYKATTSYQKKVFSELHYN